MSKHFFYICNDLIHVLRCNNNRKEIKYINIENAWMKLNLLKDNDIIFFYLLKELLIQFLLLDCLIFSSSFYTNIICSGEIQNIVYTLLKFQNTYLWAVQILFLCAIFWLCPSCGAVELWRPQTSRTQSRSQHCSNILLTQTEHWK